jgi:hypothetical protein
MISENGHYSVCRKNEKKVLEANGRLGFRLGGPEKVVLSRTWKNGRRTVKPVDSGEKIVKIRRSPVGNDRWKQSSLTSE